MIPPRGNTKSSGGRPRLEEVERRQWHLLDVAAELFIAQGYAATSIEGVAAKAGVSKATIYTRYRDKAGLFKAVVDHVWTHKTIPMDRPILASTGIAAIKEQLENNIIASIQPAYVGLFRLFLSEARRFPELVEIFPARGDAYRLLVAQLERHAEFAGLSAWWDEIAYMLVSMTGILVTSCAVQDGFCETLNPKEEAARLVDVCLFGFSGLGMDNAPSA